MLSKLYGNMIKARPNFPSAFGQRVYGITLSPNSRPTTINNELAEAGGEISNTVSYVVTNLTKFPCSHYCDASDCYPHKYSRKR